MKVRSKWTFEASGQSFDELGANLNAPGCCGSTECRGLVAAIGCKSLRLAPVLNIDDPGDCFRLLWRQHAGAYGRVLRITRHIGLFQKVDCGSFASDGASPYACLTMVP
jgi:hypothetical protein